jgi:hypothetical protein
MASSNVLRFGSVLMVLATSMSVVAQTACPVGVPPGDPRCGPSPSWHPGQPQNDAVTTSPQPRVVERWEVFDDRFGAVALDESGAFGMSSGATSREQAVADALAQCGARGGRQCEVVNEARNLCTTFAWGGGIADADNGEDVDASQRNALMGCAKGGGKGCEVIETACSLPVSRWVYEKPKDFVPAR